MAVNTTRNHDSVNTVALNGRFRVHTVTGTQRYALELARRFGNRVRVLEPGLKLTGVLGHIWEQSMLPIKAGSDLLWSPCNTGPCWCRTQVVTIHDMFTFDHPEWFSSGFVHLYRLLIPTLVRNVRRVIAVSEHTRRSILHWTGVSEQNVEVIYNGIGREFAPQSELSMAAARAAAGIKGRYFLSVSSLEPRKNVKGILRAWEMALPEIPEDFQLVMAGGAGLSTAFGSLDLSHIPDRVVLPGYIPEAHLPGLYAGAHAFVFPSLAEGFGFPPLEAMACGTPVLTSSTTALEEVCGEAAWLIDPMDTDAIANGFCRLAADSNMCTALRMRGFERASRFNWDETAARTWRLLESERDAIRAGRAVALTERSA